MNSLRQYYIVFGAIYIGATLFLTVLNMFLKLPMAGMAVIVPFLSAMLTAQRFVKAERRAPNDAERKALTFGSFGIFAFLNVILIGLVFVALRQAGMSVSEMKSVMSGLALIIMGSFLLVMFAIVFLMTWWAYGGLIRKQAARIIERD